MQNYALLFGVIEWVLSHLSLSLLQCLFTLWSFFFQFRFQMMRAWKANKNAMLPAVKTKRKSHFKSLKTIEIWIWIIGLPPETEIEKYRERAWGREATRELGYRSTTFPVLNLERVELIITYNVVRRFDRPQPAIDPLQEDHGSCLLYACCCTSCCCYSCCCSGCCCCCRLEAGKLCELSMNLYAFDWFILCCCCWRSYEYVSTCACYICKLVSGYR